MDHTFLVPSITGPDPSVETVWIQWRGEDSQTTSDPGPTPATVNEVDLAPSASSTAVGSSNSTPLPPLSASFLSMTTVLTSSPLLFPPTVSFSSPSPSTETSTSASVNTTITSPPSSAYTTGIYIALGIFLFFGVMCALVTSPVTANAIKGVRGRRGRAREQ
ncbi:uncharacterized protein Z519_07205 [Cladophialophora bantiana CBS 173.52]|uniref:Uncharacterized protein n=1 Tax=Cladophialophora bantiana (strain ATCC 10958 / CBS 173.52 / CDC B-1940 / NIH 8579) TaxID=1442370 RepID=A0A0D2EQI5_CLAB1|nr:uncharacterized protein Z519_07205 [Cladophialophora bantiana CBS 173.52]KIW92221.1 hypothetical protein Z519_07205 [Cladophialophora bantiana CBS 173.52]